MSSRSGRLFRKKARFIKQFHSEAFVEWSKRQPSIVSGRWPTVCAHNPSRGAGGTWRDISPLTDGEHREQHQHGPKTFERKHGIDFKQTNAAHAAAWEDELCG